MPNADRHRTTGPRGPDAPWARPMTLALTLALGAVVAALFLLGGAHPAPGAPSDCTLAFEPPHVVAGGATEEVRMTPSQDVPVPDSVTFHEESGLAGTLIEERPWSLMVDPTEARVGEWSVTVHENELPTCSGGLTVTGGR
jgi:hypothetical protein